MPTLIYSIQGLYQRPAEPSHESRRALTISSADNNTSLDECLEWKIKRNKKLVPLFPSNGVISFYRYLVLSLQFNQPMWLV